MNRPPLKRPRPHLAPALDWRFLSDRGNDGTTIDPIHDALFFLLRERILGAAFMAPEDVLMLSLTCKQLHVTCQPLLAHIGPTERDEMLIVAAFSMGRVELVRSIKSLVYQKARYTEKAWAVFLTMRERYHRDDDDFIAEVLDRYTGILPRIGEMSIASEDQVLCSLVRQQHRTPSPIACAETLRAAFESGHLNLRYVSSDNGLVYLLRQSLRIDEDNPLARWHPLHVLPTESPFRWLLSQNMFAWVENDDEHTATSLVNALFGQNIHHYYPSGTRAFEFLFAHLHGFLQVVKSAMRIDVRSVAEIIVKYVEVDRFLLRQAVRWCPRTADVFLRARCDLVRDDEQVLCELGDCPIDDDGAVTRRRNRSRSQCRYAHPTHRSYMDYILDEGCLIDVFPMIQAHFAAFGDLSKRRPHRCCDGLPDAPSKV